MLHKKGITIRIGKSKKTSADYFLNGQWEISKFLGQILKTIEEIGDIDVKLRGKSITGGIVRRLKKIKKND